MVPETKYAWSGDVAIAYQVVGDGPIDFLLLPTWISQTEHLWEEPSVARFFRRIQTFARLILFDRRGTGMSDRMVRPPTLEEQMDDVKVVLDAVGSERTAIFAQMEAGAMAAMFAGTHPDRVSHLMLYAPMVRGTRDEDFPWALTTEERDAFTQVTVDTWGQGSLLPQIAPTAAGDPRLQRWFGKLERLSASPTTAGAMIRLMGDIDVRPILPTIQIPTLVLHRTGDPWIDLRNSRYVAEHIPGAVLREMPGDDNLFIVGDPDRIIDEIEIFLTGARQEAEPERVLATVLFGDIVDSTRRAAEMGDRRWRDLLADLERDAGRELARHRGRPIKTLGDGFLATFDGPARGIRCAQAIREVMRDCGLETRAGLHTGEIELVGSDVAGLAVNIGARVCAAAGPGEVLVSGTVKDLVVGSGLRFADRGTRELKGVPGEWRLFAVDE